MINFIVGCIFGFIVGTVGFIGVAKALDNTIETMKTISVKVDTGK